MRCRLKVPFYIAGMVLILIAQAHGNEQWYSQKLNQAAKDNECIVSDKNFLITPEYFVSWCGPGKTQNPEGLPAYDLVVLTSGKHEWQGCPAIIKLGVYEPIPVWIEKNLKPYGETFPLSEFWAVSPVNEKAQPIESNALADGYALLYGDYDAAQILYCHDGRWIMSGYH